MTAQNHAGFVAHGCSSFRALSVLIAILMNNAKRHIQYRSPEQLDGSSLNITELARNDTEFIDDAPNSLTGSGEVQLQKALDSDVWAYCVEDAQPSISYGVINANRDLTFKKTIRVINLLGEEQTLRIRNEDSSKLLPEEQENPILFSFSPEEQVLPAECNAEVTFEVTMTVIASMAPPNRMVSGGKASADPSTMNWNEFGGTSSLAILVWQGP